MLKVGSNADSPFPGSELNKYRSIALGVGGLVFGALLFGSLAKVDVVVTGDGSVSPDFLDYTLSAPRSGEMSLKAAENGDALGAGDLILEFNCGSEERKREALSNQLRVTQGVLARGLRLSGAVFEPELAASIQDAFGAFVDETNVAFADKTASIFIERQKNLAKAAERSIEKVDAELSALQVKREKTTVDSELAKASLDRTRALAQKGHVTPTRLVEEQAAATSSNLSEKISTLEVERTAAEKEELQFSSQSALMNEREAVYLNIERSVEALSQLQEKIADAERSLRGCHVRTPVQGEIFWLASVAPGSWISAGQPLAKVVPSTEEIIIETRIAEKDIAFIRQGQPAVIKLNSLPFTRYGALDGVVRFVSPDTVEDKIGRGTYRLYVQVEKNAFANLRNGVTPVPGMAAQVDIVTGKRRVIEYFIDPILRAVNSSFKEI